MKKIIASAILGLAVLSSCQDMDIPPKNIVTSDDLLTSESGMDIYMATAICPSRISNIVPMKA